MYTDIKDNGQLLFPHGGYRKLKSFQLAQLCFDITVRFVELYIPKNSRTIDQMVQAARSGVQNIAEGSVASATSISFSIVKRTVKSGNIADTATIPNNILRFSDANVSLRNSSVNGM